MPFTLVSVAAVLIYIWLVEPRAPRGAVAVPIGVVIVLGLLHAVRRREWGLNPGAMAGGMAAAGLFTLVACAVVIAAGARLGTLHARPEPLTTLGGLVLWGAAQQWILQTVALREAQAAAGRRAGIVVAAALFATLHLPNPFLAAVTLVGALGWCAIYTRYPNVVPLALSHAVGTLVILHAFDDDVTGRLRIGAAYLELSR